MKRQAMSKGLRLTLSQSEVEALIDLAEMGPGSRVDAATAAALCQGLRAGLSELRSAQSNRGSAARERKLAAAMRDATSDHRNVDGYTVMSTLSDYADHSRDPDRRDWTNQHHYEIQVAMRLRAADAPEQCELRRSVWHVRVLNPTRDLDDFQPMFVGNDCTMTMSRTEIEPVARAIIERRKS